MAVNDPTTEQPNLLGEPVNARDTITTALVQPEVLAALLKAMDEQESPVDVAVPLETGFLEAVDKYLRKKIGPLPWVRHTLQGTVTAVGTRTCTVAVPGIDAPVTGVLFGPNRPTVGDRYPVRFPVALPPEGTLLAEGPKPFGPPWIKVPGGGQTWIYYRVGRREGYPNGALFRVPLPGPDPDFTYAEADAQLIAIKGPFPDFGFWGGETQGGVVVTHFSRDLWIEDQRWTADRDALKGLHGNNRPWATLLLPYVAYGADPDQPNTLDGPGLRTSYPWTHLTGASLDTAPEGDYLLGFEYSVEYLPLPADNPTFRAPDLHNVRIELANSTGGTAWSQRSTQAGFGQKMHITFDDANGYHAGFLTYIAGGLLDAAGWTAEATTAWASEGQRISYWALQQRTPDPFPTPSEIVPLSRLNAIYWPRLNQSPARVRVWVAVGDGSAREVDLPGQPSGWVEPYPGFFLRPTGPTTLRAWWCGRAVFTQTQAIGGGPVTTVTSPVQLWRGELDLAGGAPTWTTISGGVGLNTLIATNRDASIVLAGASVAGEFGGSTTTVYLTQDAGETWRALPPPPGVVEWGIDTLRAWLIDTP